MRLVVLAVILCILAGCMRVDTESVADAAELPAGVYTVDLDGIQPAPDHSAVQGTMDANGTHARIDMIPLLAEDSLSIVIIEYIGSGSTETLYRSSIQQDPVAVGEGEDPGDYCWTMMDRYQFTPYGWEEFPIFDHSMEVAQGAPGRSGEVDYRTSGAWASGDTSGPLSNQWSVEFTGPASTVHAGTRHLVLAASSGISHSEMLQDDDEWYLDIDSDVPARIYILPPADWFCGLGFSRLDDVDHVPGPVPRSVGGHVVADTLYGATVGIDHQFPDASIGDHRAAFSINGSTLPADPAGMARTVASSAETRLDNDEWTGRALWMVAGYPMPANGWFEGKQVWYAPDSPWQRDATIVLA